MRKNNREALKMASLFAIFMATLVFLAVMKYKKMNRRSGYEGEAGPSAGPSAIATVAEEKELTQAELDAVLKFIR